MRLNRAHILDSYHCSRYNTNTGRLTTQMFHDVFDRIRQIIPYLNAIGLSSFFNAHMILQYGNSDEVDVLQLL